MLTSVTMHAWQSFNPVLYNNIDFICLSVSTEIHTLSVDDLTDSKTKLTGISTPRISNHAALHTYSFKTNVTSGQSRRNKPHCANISMASRWHSKPFASPSPLILPASLKWEFTLSCASYHCLFHDLRSYFGVVISATQVFFTSFREPQNRLA